MNLPYINSSLPYLRNLTNTNRLLSCSTNSKSISSSSSSNKSKELNPLPILIQLCIYSDEKYSYRTMRLLLSSKYHYSPNVYDEFGCNVIMYSLRYQRYRLFQFLLNDLSSNLNLQAKDRDGNTILHYAILYSGNDTRIIEKLIQKYQKFAIKIDQRNNFGFTPLLFAAFCGRYDFVLTLLTKTDASPFVRDCIQLKSIFDYIEIDLKHQNQQSSSLNSQTKHLISQLYQTLPYRKKTYKNKNFFETFFLQSIEDQSGLFRSLIIQLFYLEYLTNLLNYLTKRYPRIQTAKRVKANSTTNFIIPKENSKLDIHYIFNLFDPELKSKAIPPEIVKPTTKTSMTFKRLSTKVTTLSAFSKTQVGKQRPSLTATRPK